MSALLPASELKEMADRLRLSIARQERALEHRPSTDVVLTENLEEHRQRMLRQLQASRNRLLRIERQRAYNTKRERLAKARHAPERRV